jgi:hypothetical protein
MAKQFTSLSKDHKKFIAEQKLFFVATADSDSRINLSPKGMDSFRITNDNTALWLNMTGSGNETAAHVLEDGRMTIMFCAFEGKPIILRLYGKARAIHPRDSEWGNCIQNFPKNPGARQIFELAIDLVVTSCGMGVPYFDYREERLQLNNWAEKKGDSGINDYWMEKNKISLDGKPTGITEE